MKYMESVQSVELCTANKLNGNIKFNLTSRVTLTVPVSYKNGAPFKCPPFLTPAPYIYMNMGPMDPHSHMYLGRPL